LGTFNNPFAFSPLLSKNLCMTQPLALVFYEKLLPGTQLVNRLQDLGYRVLTASSAESLLASAGQEKPMLVLVDLAARRTKIVEAIGQLRQNPETNHLPVIGFAEEKDAAIQSAARAAGATLVVTETAIMTHLQQFLEQALRLD
jgi:PleD family two-component response regulator